jgi:alpha-amylase
MIYYGEEVGRLGGDWPDNRSDMPWGDRKILPGAGQPRDEALRADYKKMIAIRRAHPAFSRGAHSGLSTDGDLLVFLQRDEASHDAVVVAINRGSSPATAGFDVPAEWGATPARDVWTGEAVAANGGKIVAPVAPKGFRIFAVK